MTVGRLSAARARRAQLTATVVVPAPPFAPRNTWVTHGCRRRPCAASRRAAVRRTAPWNDSSIVREACVAPPGPGKNSFAPARIAWRIRSGSAAAAMAKIAAADAPRAAARSRPCPDDASRADVDDDDVGPPLVRGPAVLDDADRHAAAAQQARDLALELLVVADDRCCELCHGSSSTARAGSLSGTRLAGAASRPVTDAADRGYAPDDSLPGIRSTKKPR